MKISAKVKNSMGQNHVTLRTNDSTHAIEIPPKHEGSGSSANGGELLFLALATCYCNNIYREAHKRGIEVAAVEVEVEGEFGAEGEPAKNVTYRARVAAHADQTEIMELMRHTDRISEIQNTLRTQTPVTLSNIEITSL